MDKVLHTLPIVAALAVAFAFGFIVGKQAVINAAVERGFAERVECDMPLSTVTAYKWVKASD